MMTPLISRRLHALDVLYVIFSVVIVIAALIMIATVLLQQGNVRGLGAITGQLDSYFSKNKAKTVEAKLALITKISAAVFVVLSLALLIVDKLA